ncbi:MAG: pH regulation protein F [Gemmatimonadetes bacterium]|nr:pH regulation protein F [Gemmatimonadota bacterium]
MEGRTVDYVISALAFIIGIALLLPFYRVIKGPTVFDRMVGVSVIGTKTIILICLTGFAFGRIDMFIDIAIAYAMLNFLGSIVIAKYLETSPEGRT